MAPVIDAPKLVVIVGARFEVHEVDMVSRVEGSRQRRRLTESVGLSIKEFALGGDAGRPRQARVVEASRDLGRDEVDRGRRERGNLRGNNVTALVSRLKLIIVFLPRREILEQELGGRRALGSCHGDAATQV